MSLAQGNKHTEIIKSLDPLRARKTLIRKKFNINKKEVGPYHYDNYDNLIDYLTDICVGIHFTPTNKVHLFGNYGQWEAIS